MVREFRFRIACSERKFDQIEAAITFSGDDDRQRGDTEIIATRDTIEHFENRWGALKREHQVDGNDDYSWSSLQI